MAEALAVPRSPRFPVPRRVLRWLTATLLVCAVTLWIAMAEIDRLVAGVVTPDGGNSSVTILSGFGAFGARDTWSVWAGLDQEDHEQLAALVTVHVAIDFAFALLYGALLFRLARGRILARIIAVTAAALDVTEGVLLLFAIRDAGSTPPAAAVLGVVTNLKWLVLALFVLGLLATPLLRKRVFGRLRRLAGTVQFHRLTVTAVGLVAVLALLPVPGINDQMPDSQRLWAEGSPGPFLASSLVVPVIALGLQYIGRLRSVLAWQLWAESYIPELPPSWRLWLAGPVVLLAALAVMAAGGFPVERSNWWQYGIFIGVPLILLAVSVVMKFVSMLGSPFSFRARWAMCPHGEDRRRAMDAWCGGDNLALLLIAVAGMSLVRSFAGPAAMMLVEPGLVASMPDGWPLRVWGLLAFGAVLAAGAYPLRSVLLRRAPRLFGPDPRNGFGQWPYLKHLVLALGAVPLLALLLAPAFFTAFLGVSATAVLGIGSWALLFGAVVVWAQQRQPLEIFYRMGFRANPILSLMAAALALGQLSGGGDAMHLPRTGKVPVSPERNAVDAEFRDWLGKSTPCNTKAGNGKTVRPMLLVAAEGGGIRAASWTTRVFGALAGTGCGKTATLLSSGVSGGSLGLVLVTRYAPRGEGAGTGLATASDAVAAPEALSVSVGGAIVSDLVAGGTGLLIPNRSRGDFAWHDRAALMEREWERRAPFLDAAFDPSARGAAGAVILNSTVTGSGCRLVLSQVKLPGSKDASDAAAPECLSEDGPPVSIDFFDPANGFCDTDLRWSTAAMISARFPLISPAGRLRYGRAAEAGCTPAGAFQAIDGGYAEGSGLGTVSDVWGTLREVVQDYNGGPGAGTEQHPYVVPVFVYIRNSPGVDLAARVPAPVAELAVPLAGLKAKANQVEAGAWLQRLGAASDVCLDTECDAASGAVLDKLGGDGTVVVAPKSRPAIDPPLGWTLSMLSQNLLDEALEAEKGQDNGGSGELPGLGKLLAVLSPPGAGAPD
ncbi:hypothetical protein [Arthrobacter cupressi]|uniref:Patatin-like phospholipase n=1 Tax=Arthrobacter cupressi TaxID=1045773 RepID=A0A1G8XS03_9MICC|nr:hypothetical protein [Arthrobacter cupressi]NYD77036.1 hypothetical protein [Arthrobacter cupressi]SDJ93216.1 hypothetical protein SAMN05216555_12039 [Arthrobacter cupressi]